MKSTPPPKSEFASIDKVMSFLAALSFQAKRADMAAFCMSNLETWLASPRPEGQQPS